MPTPPSPTTTTVWPGCGRPALMTAPPPVSTAHPSSDATAGGTSAGTGTTERRSTTAYVAKPETPRWWLTGWPPRDSRLSPAISVPAPLAALPGSQGVSPFVAHAGQWPHLGRNVMTMRCPTGMSATADPACSTMPAASWPSSIGTGRTRLPSTTDRSEWHRPAASMRTRSSSSHRAVQVRARQRRSAVIRRRAWAFRSVRARRRGSS